MGAGRLGRLFSPRLAGDRASAGSAKGYGLDANLLETYNPGDLWPLTLTDAQRRTATALCDVIIPADDKSPAASELLVVDFIDEWISAPYDEQQQQRETIVNGLIWLESESQKRFKNSFAQLSEALNNQSVTIFVSGRKRRRNSRTRRPFFPCSAT